MRDLGRVACILDPLFDVDELQTIVRALAAARWRPEILKHEVLPGSEETKGAVQETAPAEFAGLVVVGSDSPPCLAANERSIGFVRRFDELRRPLAATSAGVDLLVAAGLVAGRTVTAPASMVDALRGAGAHVAPDPVIVDGHWVTSRSAGDAQLLANIFVERLNEARRSSAKPRAVHD